MRIAVTYENGMIGQHFGRTEHFKMYEIDDQTKTITASLILDSNGAGHGALAGFLKEAEIGILICGGIGMGARAGLAQAGIEVFPGASGNADDAVEAFLKGNLAYNPDTDCNCHEHEHEHEHGECSHCCH